MKKFIPLILFAAIVSLPMAAKKSKIRITTETKTEYITLEESEVEVAPSSAVTPVVLSAPEASAADSAVIVASDPGLKGLSEIKTAQNVENDGRRLMWVPDSLVNDVDLILKGQHKVVYDESKVDLGEMVTYKGDTIPMVLKDLKLGRYDRGLYNFLFIPKGMWTIGLTASYGKFSTSDLQLFDVLSDIDISAHAFSIRPYISYAFKSNITAGLRLEYSNMQGDIGSFGLDIDEDMSFNINDVMYHSESYAASLLLTQYIGLTRKGRFGVFNEAQLKFAGGTSDFNRPFNSKMRSTHSRDFEASLTYSPGLCVFVMPQVSINLSFGVFGFYIRKTHQWEDGEKSGSRLTSGANFRFNIFNISLGLAVHI